MVEKIHGNTYNKEIRIINRKVEYACVINVKRNFI